MVRATKSAGARDHYNRRVVECRFAAALGSQAASRRLKRKIETSRLSDLAPEKLGLPEHIIDQLVQEEAGEMPLTIEGLARNSGLLLRASGDVTAVCAMAVCWMSRKRA